MKKITTIGFIILIAAAVQGQKVALKGSKVSPVPCTTLIGDYMFKPVDTTQRRGGADNYKMWENGRTLKVKFLNGGPAIRAKIMNYAKEWEQYANLKLDFVPDYYSGETDIRIRLGSRFDKLGHNSAVGQDCKNSVYNGVQTMNLDTSDLFDYDYYVKDVQTGGPFYKYLSTHGTNFNNYTYAQLYNDVITYPAEKVYLEQRIRRKSQHEFGHALGLLHEQSYPGAIHWKKDTIYKYYALMGWDKDQVDRNVLEPFDQQFSNGTNYNPRSIMHYAVYSWQTTDGFSVEENTTISDGDKQLIGALYPKNKKVSDLEVPRVNISNFNRLDVKKDPKRNAFVIVPSFELKTGALAVSAYFVARLVTADGLYYVSTDKAFYSWNGNAATYLRQNLLPNLTLSYNKGAATNKLELLFPYNQIPASLKGKNFKVEFAVYQNDAATGKMDRLVLYATSSLMSMGQ